MEDCFEDDCAGPYTVRHDHSFRMALRRQGVDLAESEQEEFLEDHGFLIDTDKSAFSTPSDRLIDICQNWEFGLILS